MKIYFLMIVMITLASLSCKKEPGEIKETKEEIHTRATAGKPACTGNNWAIDAPFYDKLSVSNNDAPTGSCLTYNNKIYLFDYSEDEIRFYNGTAWDSIASSIPWEVARPNIGFTIGDKGYLGFINYTPGVNSNYLWEYDFIANTWTSKAPYPFSNRIGVVGFSIGNKGYAAGGISGSISSYSAYKDTWEYDPATNAWTLRANLPAGRAYGTGFSIGNKGYLVNGYRRIDADSDLYYKDLLEYDPLLNQWNYRYAFPGTARIFTTVFVLYGAAYAGGGKNGNNNLQDFYKYIPSANSWEQVAGIPQSNPTLFGFAINNNGYTVFRTNIPGPFGGGFVDSIFKYQPRICLPVLTP